MSPVPGAVAEWLRSGLQSRVHQFDSGRRLSRSDGLAERLAIGVLADEARLGAARGLGG